MTGKPSGISAWNPRTCTASHRVRSGQQADLTVQNALCNAMQLQSLEPSPCKHADRDMHIIHHCQLDSSGKRFGVAASACAVLHIPADVCLDELHALQGDALRTRTLP